MHAEIKEHAGDGHFYQGWEVHEHAEPYRYGIGDHCVAACKAFNPLGLNHLANHADNEYTHHQHNKYLLDEAPGFP